MLSNIANLLHRRVRYLEEGSGRRALILVHGFPFSADMWLPQLHRVPFGYRVVAPDLRGFRGAGSRDDEPWLEGVTMDDYASDVIALMNHLDIDEAAVAGLSMGGYVAFAMMRKVPERITKLVLANTRATADSPEGRAGRDAMRAMVERDGSTAVAAAMLPKLLGTTSVQGSPDLADAVRQLIEINTADAIAAALGALKERPDSSPLLASIACPTLVIGGDEDAIIPAAEVQAMATQIPGAQCEILPRVGHMSNLEDPAAFNALVADFLAR